MSLFIKSITSKSTDWSYEKEWRISKMKLHAAKVG